MQERPKEIPTPVIMAIRRKFTDDSRKGNRYLGWDSLNGCYFFYYAGMYHGIETDGYIHT